MYKIKKENLAQKAAGIISERIIKKDLLPGERLVETKIARELGVSQATVHEALRILEGKKMVTITPNKGTIVTQLNSEYVESLYDILADLYCRIVKKFIIKMTPGDVEDLKKATAKIKDYAEAEDGLGYGEAMFDALSILISAAQDPLLEATIKQLWQVKRWVEYEALIFRKKDLMNSYNDLVEINELYIAGKGDEASQKLREHAEYEKSISLKVINYNYNAQPDKENDKMS